MAYSTQKDFLHVAFMNERPEQHCIRMEGVRLKTYSSSSDERAWSLNKESQAQYLIDLVACRMYDHEIGDGSDDIPDTSGGRPCAPNKCDKDKQRGPCDKPSERAPCPPPRDKLTVGVGNDSVICAALQEMSRIENLIAEKDDLKTQLDVSTEKLRILKEEKQTINAILRDDHYPEISADLDRQINNLKCQSKIDKDDENELTRIVDELYKREKAYKVLDAQNSYLRRLVEKLSLRGRLDSIPSEPETCTDVKYLQCEINNLRKEVSLLRSFEDQQLQKETVSKSTQESGDKDPENVARIIAERNALREKCQQFAAIEGKIIQWKHDADQYQCFRSEACGALKKKDEEIQDCHEEIEDLQFELKKLEKCCCMKDREGEAMCTTMDCLKDENRRIKEELCRCNFDLQKIPKLQDQIDCLTTELCHKNCIIDQYDVQFQQLLGAVECGENGPADSRAIKDVESTQNENMEQLATSTKETLNEISKELESRQGLEKDLAKSKTELEEVKRKSQDLQALASSKDLENFKLRGSLQKTDGVIKKSYEQLAVKPLPDADCAAQIENLNKIINDLRQKEAASSSDELKACRDKIKAQEEQIANLEKQTKGLESKLSEAGKLAADISGVRSRNENLETVLGADAQKSQNEIESLRKQLEDLKKQGEGPRNHVEDCKRELEELKKQLVEEKQKNAKHTAGGLGEKSPQRNISSPAAVGGTVEVAEKQSKSSVSKPTAVGGTVEVAEKQSKASVSKPAEQPKEYPAERETESQEKKTDDHVRKTDDQERKIDGQETKTNDQERKIEGHPESNHTVQPTQGLPGSSSKGHEKKEEESLRLSNKFLQHSIAKDRKKYEREIEGHRLSNQILQQSLSKLTTKMQVSSAEEFEREFRRILDCFIQEICKWRCKNTCHKFTKLQEIAKNIVEMGIECLTYKELIYLHQQLSEAAAKLKPKWSSSQDVKCCKCSEEICYVPMVPKESERMLLDKLAVLERDIQSARGTLRRLKLQQDTYVNESETGELNTLRASNTFRLNRESKHLACITAKPKTSRLQLQFRQDFDQPTTDRCGL